MTLIRLVEGYIYNVYTLKLKNLRYETSLPLKKTKDHKIHVFVHNLQTTFNSLNTWGWKGVHDWPGGMETSMNMQSWKDAL